MSRSVLARLIAIFLGTGILAFALAACEQGEEATQPTPSALIKASDWVNSVNWSQATRVELTMVETWPALSFNPSQLTFEAGKPYILEVVNPPGNTSKHYFATEGAADFYQAVATRKIQTSQAEYKAPYFKAVENQLNGTLEIYFVPVLPGTYDFLCIIPGHKEAGMVGKITVTGSQGNQLDLEVATDWNRALDTDARTSGSDPVWSSKTEVPVEIVEVPSFGYVPKDLNLTKDRAFKIVLNNTSGNSSPHYYTAAEFYKTVVTRKAEDPQAEIKAPYFKAVEVLIGGKTELFMVPTLASTFETLCTIPGHADRGMKGTVVVAP